MEVSVQFCEAPSREVREAILAPLVRYNDSKVGVSELRPIAVEIRSADGQVTGGLWGGTIYGWLYIELLVVPEPLRGPGARPKSHGDGRSRGRESRVSCGMALDL